MLKDLVYKNRSYRGFDETRAITKEELTAFVDLTRYTASTANLQPLKYYIASAPEQVDAILSLTKWAGALPECNLPHPGMHPTGFVIICHDTAVSPDPAMFQKDVGIAAQTMLLAAVEQQLGGCMIANFDSAGITARLALPDSVKPQLVVAFGKPAETVKLVPVQADNRTAYYRDETGTHYVPKRSLTDIVL